MELEETINNWYDKKTKLIKKPLEEMQGDETTSSISSQKEDELKRKGINLQSFKSKRFV